MVDWLAWLELGGAASRTLDQYERDLARLCKLYPDTPFDQVTDGDLLQLAKRFRPSERRVRMAAVKSFFKWGKQTRRIADNPTEYLPAIKRQPHKVPDVFTDAEVEQLLALDVVDAAPLAILIHGGLRKAEARHLRLKDCIPEFGQLIVRNGKGGKDRIVPMSERLQQLLTDLEILDGLNHADHVFYAVRANAIASRRIRRDPVGEGTFARWWRSCLDQADVRYRNPHTTRHTFATSWRRRGLAIEDVQLLLGHASIATTADIYDHTTVEDVARRMTLIVDRERELHS